MSFFAAWGWRLSATGQGAASLGGEEYPSRQRFRESLLDPGKEHNPLDGVLEDRVGWRFMNRLPVATRVPNHPP
jgi:hypothetical protein